MVTVIDILEAMVGWKGRRNVCWTFEEDIDKFLLLGQLSFCKTGAEPRRLPTLSSLAIV